MLKKIKQHKFISILLLIVAIIGILVFLFLPYNTRGCVVPSIGEGKNKVFLPVYCKGYSNFEIFLEQISPDVYL